MSEQEVHNSYIRIYRNDNNEITSKVHFYQSALFENDKNLMEKFEDRLAQFVSVFIDEHKKDLLEIADKEELQTNFQMIMQNNFLK